MVIEVNNVVWRFTVPLPNCHEYLASVSWFHLVMLRGTSRKVITPATIRHADDRTLTMNISDIGVLSR